MNFIHATVSSESSCKVDLPALIREYLEDYLRVDLRGYQDWERPSVFLTEILHEETSIMAPSARYIQPHWDDEVTVDFSWTERNWAELLTVCPEADPGFHPSDLNDLRIPGPMDVPLPLDVSA